MSRNRVDWGRSGSGAEVSVIHKTDITNQELNVNRRGMHEVFTLSHENRVNFCFTI